MRVLLVKSLIMPLFTNCNTTIVTGLLKWLANFSVLKMIICLLDLKSDDHVSSFYKQISLFKANLLIKFHVRILLHTVLQTTVPMKRIDIKVYTKTLENGQRCFLYQTTELSLKPTLLHHSRVVCS